MKLIQSTPVRLFVLIVLTSLFFNHISLQYRMHLLSISLFIKEVLAFVLPYVILSSIYAAIKPMQAESLKIVPVIIIIVCISNFSHVLLSTVVIGKFIPNVVINLAHMRNKSNLEPLWFIHIPRLLDNNHGLLAGFVLGFLSIYKNVSYVDKTVMFIYRVSHAFLHRVFVPALPLFVLGFIIQLLHNGVMEVLFNNKKLILFIIGVAYSYLIVLLMIAVNGNMVQFKTMLLRLIPPFITAFTTTSSAITLPLSIEASTSNTGDEKLTQLFLPTTVNIHLLGDSICIPLLAIIVCKVFELPFPMEQVYLFAFMFMVTKFSGAGVPGGTIFIMSPMLQTVLGFSQEMITTIVTLYILIDSITTSTNVLGNNIAILLFQKGQRLLCKPHIDRNVQSQYNSSG